MTTILLSIILVSGYLFTINALPLRYRFKRSEGWGAYFFVAAWGIGFFIVSWTICSVLSCLDVPEKLALWLGLDQAVGAKVMPFTDDKTHITLSQQMATWSVFTMFLAFTAGKIVKKWYDKDTRKHAALIKAAKGNPIEELMIEASLTAFAVKITMKSRKVYIGWVRKPALEHGKLDYISLIPLLSGARSEDEHRVKFFTNYHNHYQNSGVYSGTSRIGMDQYRVVLPVGEIDNASLFDLTTYANFNKTLEIPTVK
ncbi:MAG TPA: hypothetical protein VGN40_13075 [Lelliottia sp.]